MEEGFCKMRQRVKANLLKRIRALHEHTSRELERIFAEYEDLFSEEEKKPRKRERSPSASPSVSSEEEDDDIELFDDEEEEEEESSSGNDIDLGSRVDPYDQRMLERLVASIRKDGYEKALESSRWFRLRYGDAMHMIRDGMGYNSQEAHRIFSIIKHQLFSVELYPLAYKVRKTCVMCNSTRDCAYCLSFAAEKHYVASHCFQLVEALLGFFRALSDMEEHITDCDLAILDHHMDMIMMAHASKAGNK